MDLSLSQPVSSSDWNYLWVFLSGLIGMLAYFVSQSGAAKISEIDDYFKNNSAKLLLGSLLLPVSIIFGLRMMGDWADLSGALFVGAMAGWNVLSMANLFVKTWAAKTNLIQGKE